MFGSGFLGNCYIFLRYANNKSKRVDLTEKAVDHKLANLLDGIVLKYEDIAQMFDELLLGACMLGSFYVTIDI